jgi:xylulose-5-phosphate/fructose-6-phosphate phosphoketolase
MDDPNFELLNRYWQACNYLSVGQIYLKDNVLLKQPLAAEHIKPRLLGHWGTSPGLNLIYVHLNRLINSTGAQILFIAGPGHGAPAVLANTYLEGSYTDVYPAITQDKEGLQKFFRQFSTPGGIPSHVSADTPGSIHEGGELGYCLSHAAGAVFDNPELIAACVIGDGEAETAPLEGSWKTIRFLNPKRDGAVMPILHLNGYKISSSSVLGRMSKERVMTYLEGYGYEVHWVEGSEPSAVHPNLAENLDLAYQKIRLIQKAARSGGNWQHMPWPLIVLQTPKGWTCPKEVDGQKLEGTFRSHQVPLEDVVKDPGQLAMLEKWLLSYQPDQLFDDNGSLNKSLRKLIPEHSKRMGSNLSANGGLRLKELILPEPQHYQLAVPTPGQHTGQATMILGEYLRDVFKMNENEENFRLFCPDETESNRLGAVFEATGRMYLGETGAEDENLSATGRVMEVLSEHLCQGWMEGYLLTGRHGIFSCYEAFITIIDSMFNQYAKWLKTCSELSWRAPLASFNYLLTSHTWRQDHNGYSHQGPGFIDTVASKKREIVYIFLPPDANSLLMVMHQCLTSKNKINLVIAGKQPELQWMDMSVAETHCKKGLSVWEWAGNDRGSKPDIILACAGDVPTLEAVAASWLIQKHLPELKVRLVNVVNLLSLTPEKNHEHGISDKDFSEIFTDDAHVVFAFHGYVGIIHDLIHGRPNPERFHVRGFKEEGTTTTPFDMVVLNEISRYHLAMEAVSRSEIIDTKQGIDYFEKKLIEHHHYIREHLEDMPEIQDWKWSSID